MYYNVSARHSGPVCSYSSSMWRVRQICMMRAFGGSVHTATMPEVCFAVVEHDLTCTQARPHRRLRELPRQDGPGLLRGAQAAKASTLFHEGSHYICNESHAQCMHADLRCASLSMGRAEVRLKTTVFSVPLTKM